MCKNICERYETKTYHRGYSFLGLGWKKCRTCCISIKIDSWKCPCCKRKLGGVSYKKQRKESLLTN